MYEVLVAASVTASGRAFIKGAMQLVADYGFIPRYGDTDSIYGELEPRFFAESKSRYDEKVEKITSDGGKEKITSDGGKELLAVNSDDLSSQLLAAKKEYCGEMIMTTIAELQKLRVLVSKYALKLTNDNFLSMAFEEVGFPTLLAGKKKYALLPHLNEVNWNAKPMIRGFDFIKQGQAKFCAGVGHRFLNDVLNVANELPLVDLGIKHFSEMISFLQKNQQDSSQFVLMGRYKIGVKNVKIQTFHTRMTNKLAITGDTMYTPPEAGDKFKYVIVRTEREITIKGVESEASVGAKMEYVTAFEKSQTTDNPMKIDIKYYVETYLVGLFARFIGCDPMFAPPPTSTITLPDRTVVEKPITDAESDKYRIAAAGKKLLSVYSEVGESSITDNAQFRKTYAMLYRRVVKHVKPSLVYRFGVFGELVYELYWKGQLVKPTEEQLRTTLDEYVAKNTEATEQNVSGIKINMLVKNAFELRSPGSPVSKTKELLISKHDAYVSKLMGMLPDIHQFFDKYNNDMRDFNHKETNARYKIGIDDAEFVGVISATHHKYEVSGVVGVVNELVDNICNHSRSVKTLIKFAVTITNSTDSD
jgi:hypothetical protein